MVSKSCWKLFEQQDEAYQKCALPCGRVYSRTLLSKRQPASAETAGNLVSMASTKKARFVGIGCDTEHSHGDTVSLQLGGPSPGGNSSPVATIVFLPPVLPTIASEDTM